MNDTIFRNFESCIQDILFVMFYGFVCGKVVQDSDLFMFEVISI